MQNVFDANDTNLPRGIAKRNLSKKLSWFQNGWACLPAAGRGLGFEIKKVFEQIYSIGQENPCPKKFASEKEFCNLKLNKQIFSVARHISRVTFETSQIAT